MQQRQQRQQRLRRSLRPRHHRPIITFAVSTIVFWSLLFSVFIRDGLSFTPPFSPSSSPDKKSAARASPRGAVPFPSVMAAYYSDAVHALEHLFAPPLFRRAATPLEDVANARIPGPPGTGIEILAHVARPRKKNGDGIDEGPPRALPLLVLLHEFFGLNDSIVEKANALSDELGCVVVAPDTFRGDVTDFVPKALWLALTTPTERVNDDLDAVCSYFSGDGDGEGTLAAEERQPRRKVAVMGFCYGGGKAIRYTTERNNDAATVVFYGKPVTDVVALRKLRAPVCGVYGRDDVQFPMPLVESFERALSSSSSSDGGASDNNNSSSRSSSNNKRNVVRVYDGVGHAFWSSMDQIRNGEQPQTDAYNLCTEFLREFFYDDQ